MRHFIEVPLVLGQAGCGDLTGAASGVRRATEAEVDESKIKALRQDLAGTLARADKATIDSDGAAKEVFTLSLVPADDVMLGSFRGKDESGMIRGTVSAKLLNDAPYEVNMKIEWFTLSKAGVPVLIWEFDFNWGVHTIIRNGKASLKSVLGSPEMQLHFPAVTKKAGPQRRGQKPGV